MIDASRYGPWAVIAGASEGIGEHAARQLAAAGCSVVLVSRRPEVLDALRTSILADDAAPGAEVRCVALDLATDDAADRLCAEVADLDVGLLFYNAGADVRGQVFLDRDADEVLGMVRCNVVTATALCHALGRRMRDRGRGGVVVMSSGAAIAGAALIATYSATKAYQQILCEALWAELDGTGVDVVCVLAGTTATPAFLRTAVLTADDPSVMDPAVVAANALAALGHGPAVGASDELTQMFAGLYTVPRTMLIEGVSAGTRANFGLDG
ncbi:MAG: SDR family NAD(P)-dependent oxidoreductase [Actinobacteria bacterium]|nr:SDR family NAD(P)-dependent oxidoreductase [Actinomycetota bacterium]